MIVVDSSVWIAYFNGASNRGVVLLEEAVSLGRDIAIHPIILTEVLMGFHSDSDFRAARSVLGQVPSISVDEESHVRAAQLFRSLRRKGVTVRGAVDCVIAQACIDCGAVLLTLDRDFARMAAHSDLRLMA